MSFYPPTPSAGRSPMLGLVTGIVIENKDPEGLGRVKVRLPWLSEESFTTWARVATPLAGSTLDEAEPSGLYLLPDVETEVLVAFAHGSADHAYVLGALWNGRARPPETNEDDLNNVQLWRSRSGLEIRLDDTEGEEKVAITDLEKTVSIVLDATEGKISIQADTDISISAKGALNLSAEAEMSLSAGGALKISADDVLEISAGADVTVEGATINLN